MALEQPLPWAVVAALAIMGGFPPGPAAVATSITEPESARIQNNVQQGQPYATTGWGLWQITPGNSVPQFGTDDQLLIGLNNAKAAHAKWSGAGGFTPWTTFVNGLNTPYLPAAEKAVAAVSNLPVSELHRLANEASAAGSGHWTPDQALMRFDALVKRLLSGFNHQLVDQRMAYQRIYRPGWRP